MRGLYASGRIGLMFFLRRHIQVAAHGNHRSEWFDFKDTGLWTEHILSSVCAHGEAVVDKSEPGFVSSSIYSVAMKVDCRI